MASAAYKKRYDVFISFRGPDVRQGFVSHLYGALLDQKIQAFLDDQLERGGSIAESISRTIEESCIAIVVFSENYAYSEWCMKELERIAGWGQTEVIPVFYGVDPAHVQNLTGSYGDAMARHRTDLDESTVENWGTLLRETASLPGLLSSEFRSDCSLIEGIVEHTYHFLEILNCLYPSYTACNRGLVGISSRLEKVMSLLCGSEDVRVVGIWGEGGIGKTTLARATFDAICSQFDSQCFVGDVREKFEKSTANPIQNEVVSKLFGTRNSDLTRKRLSRKKAILVLDDVSDLDHIKFLTHFKVNFGFGSRIIVTSRDHHLLKDIGAEIYAVEELGNHEALRLFCLSAFNKNVSKEGYSELCARAVEYAQGLPLALKLLGSNLFQTSVEEFEDELEKLKGARDKNIQKLLRISYDVLPDIEKEIVQDIACCYKGRKKDEVESLLGVAGLGISRLAEIAFISICSTDNCLKMHDLIEQMAKDIICEEKTLDKRRCLWDPEEIYILLTKEMGTEAVRGISLDMSKIRNINLSPTEFMKLYNLKYLDFYAPRCDKAQVSVPRGLEYLPEQLRYLRWDQYPSTSLPMTSFLAENIVELDMRDSQLEVLWDGVQNFPNLKKINLCGSKELIKIPYLSRASNLEILDLSESSSLAEIPSSLGYASKLIKLMLGYCSRLQSLPDDICNLKSLLLLDVSNCENLHGLPNNFGNLESLKKLKANRSGIKEIPDSICNLKACTTLNFRECLDLHRIPQNIGNLESLKHLLFDGSGIKEVPLSINNMRELRRLTFSGCKGLILPPFTGDFPRLGEIDLTNCGISEFPIGLCSVTSLIFLYLVGNNFESIPESIQNLLKLKTLALNGCKKLKCLPESTKKLTMMEYLDLRHCTSLDQNQCSRTMDHLITANLEDGREDDNIYRILYPGSGISEKMKLKNEFGSSLAFSFKLPHHLDGALRFCAGLVIDRQIFGVRCEGNVIDDESGLSLDVEANGLAFENDFDAACQSKHVLVEQFCFWNKNIVTGRKYRAEFHFKCLSTEPQVGEDVDRLWTSDGIIKCGALFEHHTME